MHSQIRQLILLVVCCVSVVGLTAAQLPDSATLNVVDSSGQSVALHPGERTKVFAVASWCPHTKSFVRAISDRQVRDELKSYKLVFVLAADEWASVRRQLVRQAKDGKIQGLPIDEVIKRLKARAGNGPVYDPEFLDVLPGPYYFLPKHYPGKITFPSTYSNVLRTFHNHAMDWAETKSTRARNLYDKFEKESN